MRKKRSDALPPDVLKANQKAAAKRYSDTHKEVLAERQRKRRNEDPAYRASQIATSKAWRERKKAEGVNTAYISHLKHKYNKTPEQVATQLAEQNNACAICHEPFTKTPHNDHSHLTGQNRGLLCSACNHMLGKAGDSIVVLQSAIAYLMSYAERN